MPAAPVDRVAARAGVARPPGARALRTRERLLECTRALIDEVPYRELTSAVVTQRLRLSPGSFYRYFGDINDAVLELTAAMRTTADDIAALVTAGEWSGPAAHETALVVIDAMAEFWNQHRALYRVTDLCADQGDERFGGVKAATFASLTAVITDVVASAKERGAIGDDVEPFPAACVVVAMLIHTMARESAFGLAGVGRASLRTHVAQVMVTTMTGTTATAQ